MAKDKLIFNRCINTENRIEIAVLAIGRKYANHGKSAILVLCKDVYHNGMY